MIRQLVTATKDPRKLVLDFLTILEEKEKLFVNSRFLFASVRMFILGLGSVQNNPQDPNIQPAKRAVRDVFSLIMSSLGKQAADKVLKCQKCKQPIVGSYTQVNDGGYHPSCFSCKTCGIQLQNASVWQVALLSSNFYCEG
jgi:hypothetical protein